MAHACWTACDPWNCACAAKMQQAQMVREKTVTITTVRTLSPVDPKVIRLTLPLPKENNAMRAEDV